MPRAGRRQYDIWARRMLPNDRRHHEGPVWRGIRSELPFILNSAEIAPRPPFDGPLSAGHALLGTGRPWNLFYRPRFGMLFRACPPSVLYHSRDDSEDPFEHLERYSAALPQAIVRALDGRGHEFIMEFPGGPGRYSAQAHLPCR